MNTYLPPSLRRRDHGANEPVEVTPAPKPLPAPEFIAVVIREPICEAQCGKLGADTCPLGGCCAKTISENARMALSQCPAGHWPRWLPTKSNL